MGDSAWAQQMMRELSWHSGRPRSNCPLCHESLSVVRRTDSQPLAKVMPEPIGPLIQVLEAGAVSPSDRLITTALQAIDADHVRDAWSKALERRTMDPEGAITMARSLIETVCKHILDAAGEGYTDVADITRLYGQTARVLAIAPSQRSEQVFGGTHRRWKASEHCEID